MAMRDAWVLALIWSLVRVSVPVVPTLATYTIGTDYHPGPSSGLICKDSGVVSNNKASLFGESSSLTLSPLTV